MAFCGLRKRGSIGRLMFMFVMLFFIHQTFISKNYLTAVPYRMVMDAGAIFDLQTEGRTFQDLIHRPPYDPELVEYVRSHLIKPHSGKEYNLTNPQMDLPSRGQSTKVDNYFQGHRNGTFIDIGAADGEFDSVTLFFERHRDWKGLLVEPNATRYQRMQQKHRKAATLNACVKGTKTKDVSFKVSRTGSEVNIIKPCLSIGTILQAYNQKTIDLINIDVHNNEVAILKSIPYDKFNIRVITMELSTDVMGELPDLYHEMDRKGYYTLHQFTNKMIKKVDVIFVNKKNKLHLKVT